MNRGLNYFFLTVSVLNGQNFVDYKFQVVIAKQVLTKSELIKLAKNLSMVYIIGVNGYLGKYKVRELSLFAKSFIHLFKCLPEISKEQYNVKN